ncbi:unnamed protein product [Rhizopus stolonifer]
MQKNMWTLVQNKRKELSSQLDQLYHDQREIEKRRRDIKQELKKVTDQKEQALRDQNFAAAHDLQLEDIRYRKELESIKPVSRQIQLLWRKIAEVLMEEAERAQDMQSFFEEKKKEKKRECDHYAKNMDHNDEVLLEKIRLKREEIHNQRSEIALDVELWKRNDAELNEKMYEMVMDDIEKKKDLEEKSFQVQNEIDGLLEKVRLLEGEKGVYETQIAELDEVMENKLKPVTDKKIAHEQEMEDINQRQKEMDEKSDMLDKEDMKLNTEMKLHSEEKARGLKEIEELDANIKIIVNKKMYGKEEANETMNILQNQIEARDEAIDFEGVKLKEAKNTIRDIIEQVESLQSSEYEHEQRQMQLDYTILQFSSKLKNLQRQRQLAAETEQYEKLSFACEQIRLTEERLNRMEKEKASLSPEELQTRLSKKKDELKKTKEEYRTLEIEIENNIANILSDSYKELMNLKNNHQGDTAPALKELIEHELISIKAQTNAINGQENNLMFF